MKLDLTVVMKMLDGEPVKVKPDDPSSDDLTLRDVVTSALLNEPPNSGISGQEKAKRYALAVKAYGANGHPLEVTIEEAKLIMDQIALTYMPLVCGQAWQIFETQSDGKDTLPGE